ncbi:MAG: MFS transporter [Alphaproteobacteria bacterium]|nr:MFS transporter [Alphaproteobacteria bacterium]MBF0249308.1 MFS transporter [Alphaproteobacteria bacterium]
MLILFLIVFIDLVGFGIVIPLLPFYGEHFQADPFTVSLIMASYSLGQFAAAPFWGRLSDAIGRRPVLILTLAGAAASYVWLGFADALWILFAARILGGLMAGNISTAFAYIADVTTPENRAKGMGMVGAAFGLGFIAGPAIGGLLAGPDPLTADYQTPAFAAAGLSALALVLTVLLLKESLPPEMRKAMARAPRRSRWTMIRHNLQRPGLGMLLAISFMATFVFAGMETTFAMWSSRRLGWGPEQNGFLFALIGVASVILQGGLVGRMARRFGEGNLIVQGSVTLGLGLGLIPFCDNAEMLVGAMLLVAYGFSVMNPALNSLISLRTSAAEQGEVMGVTRSATTMARVVGPAWAGVLFAQLGMDWPYFAGMGLMVVVSAFAIGSLKDNQDAKTAALQAAAGSATAAPDDADENRDAPLD